MVDRQKLKSALTVVLTVVVLAVLLWIIDLKRLRQTVVTADPVFLGLSIGILSAQVVLKTIMWQLVLQLFGYSVSLWRCFSTEMAARPVISLTPSQSGELTKMYYFRDEVPESAVGISILYTNILDASFLGLFGALGIVTFVTQVRFGTVPDSVGVAVAVTITLIGVIVVRYRTGIESQVRKSLDILAANLDTFRTRSRLVLWTGLVSFSQFFLSMLQVLCLFYAIDITPPWLYAITRIPVAILVGLLPVTVAGMGTRDAAFIVLFSKFAIAEQLFTVGILFTAVRYWLLSLAGIPFMYLEGR